MSQNLDQLQIFLARNNEQAGPYSLQQLNEMLANGNAILTDLAWHDGLSDWQPLYQLTHGKLEYLLSESKPLPDIQVKEQKAHESSKTPKHALSKKTGIQSTTYVLASYKKRLFAKLLDLSLLFPAIWVQEFFIKDEWRSKYEQLSQALMQDQNSVNLQNLLAYLVQIRSQLPESYFMIQQGIVVGVFLLQAFLITRYSQSLGKMLMGIKIIDATTGKNAGFMQGFLNRSLLTFIFNQLTMFIYGIVDLLTGIGDPQKRFLHDRIARTLVVNKQPHAQTIRLTK